jgi:hypothetical protein
VSEHVHKTIADVQVQIDDLLQQVAQKKQAVNTLCSIVNQPPIYADVTPATSRAVRPPRPDEYYGQPLSTTMRMVLERRQLAGMGPATVNDIYDAMMLGGYKFNTSNDEYAKRGLYSALTKNSATFHKLPNGLYGLLEWYPGVKEPKPAKGGKAVDAPAADDAQDEQGELEPVPVGAENSTPDTTEGSIESPNKPR